MEIPAPQSGFPAMIGDPDGRPTAEMEAPPPRADVSEPAVTETQTESKSMVGLYVSKKEKKEGETSEILLLGKIVFHNPDSDLYSVVYENGEREEIHKAQLSEILTTSDDVSSSRLKMSCRKRKLDLLVTDDLKKNLSDNQASDLSNNLESSTNSCESTERELKLDPVPVPVLNLPESSGDLSVPDESAGHLFSVYSFLRSFSTQLFLSPFTLSDFIGSLVCTVQNSLLDSVHLSLMKALRRHLESLSSDGSKLASKCLRYHDWSLLDTLTWPVFLLEFLYIMGYIKQLGGQKFGVNLLTSEYYQLNVSSKLKILQILCDEIIDSSDFKSELEKREEYSEESEYNADISTIPSEIPPKRGRPRKEPQVITQAIQSGPCGPSPAKKEALQQAGPCGPSPAKKEEAFVDGNSDECRICGMDGMLICCDSCPMAYHTRCIGLNKAFLPDGLWFCPECQIEKRGERVERGERGERGARVFGVDFSGRQFVGICDYLLVTGILPDVEPYHRYYNKADVARVLYRLSSNDETAPLFGEICKGICEYWPDISPIKEEPTSGGSVAKGNLVITPQKDVKLESFSSGLVTCSTIQQNKFANLRGLNAKSGGKIAPTFRPNSYHNQYFHGEISASSAATHAVLASEESNSSKSVEISNPRKAAHLMIVLQMKAFSSAAVQFVWPSSDRRQSEVPRERCGWCISCKGSTVNKRGCFLNLAASKALARPPAGAAPAGAASSLRPMSETVLTHLPAVASYLACMEESLRGLMEGPLNECNYRQIWRERVRNASDCGAIKGLLLELESSIRPVALSPLWFRLTAHSIDLTELGPARPKGRKARKREERPGPPDKDHQWWRGGKMEAAVLQRLSLSRSLARKAARRGGLRKIAGVAYHDSSEFPKINRQSAWRASVDLSKSISHLALQVRYLNSHIKWKEFIPPDQIQTEGKSAESDAAVFRNAVICDKKKLENKTIYSLKFNNQKHLPVRVTKNILESENSDELWFYENHVPLYLIKAYEEKTGVKPLLNPNVANCNSVCKNEKKRMEKYYDRDIFVYLYDRSEKPFNLPCASCRQEVLLRNVVRCGHCQGDCHESCMLSDLICKSCHAAHLRNTANRKMIQIRQTIPPPQEIPKKVEKIPQEIPKNVEKIEPVKSQGLKRKNPASGDQVYLGLRWKRKNNEKENDDATKFLLEHIVLKHNNGINNINSINGINTNTTSRPVCCLCRKPYNPNHTYIRCEKCQLWFHADSVELNESQVPFLVGFKCGKCRRKVQPKCPFNDNPNITTTNKKPKTLNPNHNNTNINTPINININISTPQPSVQSQPIQTDNFTFLSDPLLSSFGSIQPIGSVEPVGSTEPVSLSKTKLSVRRAQPNNTQPTTDSDDLNDVSVSSELQWDSSSQGDAYISGTDAYISGTDAYISAADSSSNFGWTEPSIENRAEELDDGFEPQTYFSFTELLAPVENNNNNNNNDNDDNINNINYYDNNVQFEENNDQIGAAFDELLSNSAVQQEEGQVAVQEEGQVAVQEGGQVAVCDKCKVGQPGPDRNCGLCGLSIHTHCSPWIDSDESFENGVWKCGNCREWR